MYSCNACRRSPMVRHGLKQLIELEDDIKVVSEAADGNQAVGYYEVENQI